MKLVNEFEPIRDWAKAKGFYKKGDIKTQSLKLIEEAGELCKAVLNEDRAEIEDAIGDCVVVLTSISHMVGTDIEDCIMGAYKVISKCKGKMINGTFVKDE